jgi:hypothetical protein
MYYFDSGGDCTYNSGMIIVVGDDEEQAAMSDEDR